VPALQTEMARVIVGQRYLVDRLIVGLLTNGHLLLEGVPGLAKTLALRLLRRHLWARSSADCIHARHAARRRRRHHDLQPNLRQDFQTQARSDLFQSGARADEINRAPAKVQSALLEAMQEHQVTLGEESYPLPDSIPRDGDAKPIERGPPILCQRLRSIASF